MENHVPIGQKTLKPPPAWGMGATHDHKPKAQHHRDQFCHALCLTPAFTHTPVSPRLGSLPKPVFLMPLSMRTSTSSHATEIIQGYAVPQLRPGSQEFPDFGSQHELHKQHNFSASQYPHPPLELITTPPPSRHAVRINWYL